MSAYGYPPWSEKTKSTSTFLFIRVPRSYGRKCNCGCSGNIISPFPSLSLSLPQLECISLLVRVSFNLSESRHSSYRLCLARYTLYIRAAYIVSNKRYARTLRSMFKQEQHVARRLIGAYLAKDGEPSGFHVITRSGLSRLRITAGLNHPWRWKEIGRSESKHPPVEHFSFRSFLSISCNFDSPFQCYNAFCFKQTKCNCVIISFCKTFMFLFLNARLTSK